MTFPYAVRRVADYCPSLPAEIITRRLNYSSFVNVERRYMYFEVPKAGSTLMKWLLHSVEKLPPISNFLGSNPETRRDMFIHERRNIGIPSLLDLDDETQEFVLTSPDFMRLTVVRNPYTRTESVWKDKVRLCAPRYEELCTSIKGNLPSGRDPASQVSFREFVEALSRQDLARCDSHWRLQSEHTFRGAMNFSHIGRLEDFSTLLRAFLVHVGQTERETVPAMNVREQPSEYEEEVANRVYELFRQDFDVFGYDQESWSRPANQSKSRVVPDSVFVDEVLERNIVIGHLYRESECLKRRIRELESEKIIKVESDLNLYRTKTFGELFDGYISRIDGWLSRDEAEILFDLARSVNSGCIVEIGTYRGRSTAALAFGTLAGSGVPVYAVDPQEKFVGPRGGQFGTIDRGHYMQMMVELGLFHCVRLVNLSSALLASTWTTPVGLLWIDGDHTYEAVKHDLLSWQAKLTPDAVVVLDDATDPASGPGRLVDEIIARDEFLIKKRVGKMICLEASSGVVSAVYLPSS